MHFSKASAVGAAVFLVLGLGVSACGSSPSNSAVGPTPTQATSSGPVTSTPPGSTSPTTPLATEFNPPGDIPDNAVYLEQSVPGSRVHVTVPEGWSRSSKAGVITWTDKYNSVSIEIHARPAAPTTASARTEDFVQLRSVVPKFAPGQITTVTRKHGQVVHLTYLLDSAPNPVTGKVVRDVAERFLFWHAGQEAILTLTGPEHADNVDAWRAVSDSLVWR